MLREIQSADAAIVILDSGFVGENLQWEVTQSLAEMGTTRVLALTTERMRTRGLLRLESIRSGSWPLEPVTACPQTFITNFASPSPLQVTPHRRWT